MLIGHPIGHGPVLAEPDLLEPVHRHILIGAENPVQEVLEDRKSAGELWIVELRLVCVTEQGGWVRSVPAREVKVDGPRRRFALPDWHGLQSVARDLLPEVGNLFL